MINLRGERARVRERIAQQRLQNARGRAMAMQLGGEFRAVIGAAVRILNARGPDHVNEALNDHKERVRRILDVHYRAIMETFGARLIGAVAGKSATGFEHKDTQSEFDRRVSTWIQGHAATRVDQISETTRRQIRGQLLRGQRDGLGTDEIARKMDAAAPALSRKRAAVIARTEMHTAANAAADIGVDSLGIELKKEWLSAEDGRTRESHNAADGQIRAKPEGFDVGGAKLKFPGDPLGPTREIINCRCALAWLTPGEAADRETTVTEPPADPRRARPEDVETARNAARDYVRAQGAESGFEHLVAIDGVTGEVIDRMTSRQRNQVAITPALGRMLADPARKIEVHHNHPSSSSLSGADIFMTAQSPGLSRTYAHGADGSIYWVEARGLVKVRRRYNNAVSVARREILRRISSGDLTREFADLHGNHIINAGLSRAGIFRYEAELAAPRLANWGESADIAEEIIEIIAEAVR